MEWKNISAEETLSVLNAPEEVDENIYPSLHDELKQKCNPRRFMIPYDKHKVDLANELYAELEKTPREDEEALRQLRSRAIQKLRICFSSKQLYLLLCKQCNPSNFMNPYDSEKVRIANELYASVIQKAYDIEALEEIRKSAEQLLGIKIEEERVIEENESLAGDPIFGGVVLLMILGFIIIINLIY